MTVPPIVHHPPVPAIGLVDAIVMLVLLLGALLVLVLMVRKFVHSESAAAKTDWQNPKHDSENASVFMAASMQGVIEKLRTQEKELARLHVLAQERAQESERMTEEVTRNMPTGLLLVSATGAISSSNPAAEEALGLKSLRYHSYKEILGADSDLAAMLTDCLKNGITFRRAEVEHLTQAGEVRRLGVTISPIVRPVRAALRASGNEPSGAVSPGKAGGALCLMSDLTELTA